MTITLNEKDSTNTVDLTQYLIETNKIIFTPEFERALFEKTVEDIHLSLSDLADTFTNLFYNKPATTSWQVKLADGGRTLFLGEVLNSSILFKLKSEHLDLDIFSNLKTFWDRTKVYTIRPNASAAEASIVYTTLKYIIEREFLRPIYSDLFTSVQIPADLAARPLRGWANDPGLGIGNNGRYGELAGSWVADPNDPYRIVIPSESMKGFDLLDAFSRYYNVEFVLDYDLNALVLHKRHTPLNAAPVNGQPINIDSILMDDPEPEAQLYEDDKYDYIHVPRFIPPSQPPVIDYIQKLTDTTGLTGNVSYVFTEVQRYEATGVNFELPSSLPISVDIKSILSGYLNPTKSVKVWLRIPDGSLQIGLNGHRRLYRTKQGGGDFYLLRTFDSNSKGVQFVDWTKDLYLNTDVTPPSHLQTMMAWMHYDESAGVWSDIIDHSNGNDPPSGKIREVIPRLQFREISNNVIRPYSSFDVVAFFGLEAIDPSFTQTQRESFKDLFLTKHKFICNVESTNVKAGDAATASGLASLFLAGSMVIKKAEVDLMAEQSRLELISV